jgi:hypothetical protein
LSRKCGSFDVSQSYRHPRPVTGIALNFYLLETFSLTVGAFENRLLRGIFGFRREDITGGCRKYY